MDKKSILAFLLIFIILILTPYIQRMFGPPAPEISRERIYQDSTDVSRDTLPGRERPVAEETEPELRPEEQTRPDEIGFQSLRDVQEEEVVIENQLYTGIISTKGATIKSWVLKSYPKHDDLHVNLINNNKRGNLSLEFLSIEDKILNFSEFGFLPEELDSENGRYYVDVENRQKTVTFTLNLGNNRRIEKIFTFYPDTYEFDMTIRLVGLSDLFGSRSYYVTWGSGLAFSERDPNTESMAAKSYALLGAELEKLDAGGKTEEQTKKFTGDTKWIAVNNKYFTSTVIPEETNGIGAVLQGVLEKKTGQPDHKEYKASLEMAYSMEYVHENKFTVYLGPLSYENIKSFGVNLEKMMDFGWKYLRPLSKLIYHSLVNLHKLIPNYGIVIIIFAIILNILLYPLTMKSYKSMKEMQTLQPKLMELKEKYKSDPQRLNKETMKLYKEHGVNPMGSCLPMVLQMPVFFSLYPVFRSSIEFRRAEFMLWINDLSSPDTIAHLPFSLPLYGDAINVLPIIWVVTMFFSQKMTMKDPKQKFMVYFMPIMMLLIFNRLSSGLVLYWTVFNLLSVAQRRITKID